MYFCLQFFENNTCFEPILRTMLKKSFIKFLLWFLSTTIVLGIGFYFRYTEQKKQTIEALNQEFKQTSERIRQKIEVKLKDLTHTSGDFVAVLENGNLKHNELVRTLRELVRRNPSIYGLCAAYEPYAYNDSVKYYEPYIYRDTDSLLYVNYDIQPEDYFLKEWYKPAKESAKPVWTEPYADSTAGMTVMATYSIPFKRKTGEVRGVLATDIFLLEFSSYLSEFEIFETGFAFLVSASGAVMTYPDTTMIMRESLTSFAQKFNSDIRLYSDSVKAGIIGTTTLPDFSHLSETQLSYAPLSSGWELYVIVPYSDFKARITIIRNNNLYAFLISAGSIFVVLLGLNFYLVNKIKNKRASELEALIEQRTAAIQHQNDLLHLQKSELSEKNNELLAADEELRQNNEELTVLKENLEDKNLELTQASSKLYERAFIGELLALSIRSELKINEFLQSALELMFKLPWLNIVSKGAVFLKDKDENLILTAQKDLGDLVQKCAIIKPGQCYCGRALELEKTLFHNHITPEHSIKTDEMTEHGHYNVPLSFSGNTLGILNVDVEHEHAYTHDEAEFLETIASILAAVVHRDTIQAQLKNQANELSAKNEILSHFNIQLNKYYTALEQSPVTVVITDTNGTIEYVNPYFTALTGWTYEEAVGRNPRILRTQHTPKETFTNLWETIIAGNVWEGKLFNQTKQHELFIERAIIAPVKDPAGNIINYIAIKEDITEFEKAQLTIREKTEQFENTLKNLEDIYFKADVEGRLIYASPSVRKHLGYKNLDEIIAAKVFEQIYVNEKFKDEFLQSLYSTGRFVSYAVTMTHKAGSIFHGTMNVIAQYNANKQPIGFEGIIHNVTQRKKYEQDLKRLNKEMTVALETTKQQKVIIEQAHKNITDSINYAKSIQDSMLMAPSLMQNYAPTHFLIYQPKEVVSGDFYYIATQDNFKIFAVADCTGHGVPGGFLTMLAISFLNEIIKRDKVTSPSDALEMLRSRFKTTFKNFGNNNSNGLDIVLSFIDTETAELQFSGANNPLYIVRGTEFIELKSVKNPIGFYPAERPFKTERINLVENDTVYLVSDGYIDQLGGENYRKFGSKQFKQLITDLSDLSLETQQIELQNRLETWKGEIEQTDDITILAVKCSK